MTEWTALAEQQQAREIPKEQDLAGEDKNRNPAMFEGDMKQKSMSHTSINRRMCNLGTPKYSEAVNLN